MNRVEREIRDTLVDVPKVFEFVKEWLRRVNLDFLFNSDVVYLVGCGSSYYISIVGARYITKKLGVEARAVPGGEVYFYIDENVGRKDLRKSAILVSRSGESTEVILAGKKLRELGIPTLGITIEEGTSIFDVSDEIMLLPIDEGSVVMTKSFTTMVMAIQMVVDWKVGNADFKGIERAINNLEIVLKDSYALVEDLELVKYGHFVFLGGGMYEGVARESALKLQEMSLSVTEAFSTYEYRHGPKSLVEDGMLITIFMRGEEEERKLKRELEGYGGKVVTVGVGGSDIVLGEDVVSSVFMGAIFSQVLGLKVAERKGIDVEKPRNLTKIVRIDG